MADQGIFREAALRRHLGRRGAVHLPRIFARRRRVRVPLVMQMSQADCGAACLAMILGHHGRATALQEILDLAGGVGRDGLSARQIAELARRLGLRARGLSLEWHHLRDIEFPLIAHWDFNHFVIVEEVSDTQVSLVDPGLGRTRISREAFLTSFTGVVLTFEPGVHFERKQGSARRPWRDYLRYLSRAPGSFALLGQVLAASLVVQALGLALPALMAVIVDRILPNRLTGALPVIGLLVAAVALGQTSTFYLRARLLLRLRARLDGHLMLGFFEHVLALPYRFFQGRTSGDLILRINSNATLREALTNQTLSTILDGAFVLVYLTLLWARDPVFGAVTTLLGAAQIAILAATAGRIRESTQKHLATQAASQSYLVESLGGMETIKATGAEPRVYDHWANLFYRQLEISLDRDRLAAGVQTATSGLLALAPLLLVWIGAARVFSGALSLGTMLALEALAAAFLAPLASLVASGQSFQTLGAHLARLADVIEAPPEQDAARVITPPDLLGHIELREVSFRYAGDAPLVLDRVSLTVEPGKKIALVGPTGSGKSTLARLLLGLYEPTEGEILYDQLPLSTLEYRRVRSHFGVVLQDTFLFAGSIRDNLTLSDPGVPLSRVVEAAEIAQIAAEIEAMPLGYDTLLSEGGGGLSGGQRQRLAIARALVHRPRILLLDEATSHLDVATEARVSEGLDRLGATRIVVAHRLSTIRDADTIVVLREGKIVEVGSPAELSARGGEYARLLAQHEGG